jgi:hypothetical protein
VAGTNIDACGIQPAGDGLAVTGLILDDVYTALRTALPLQWSAERNRQNGRKCPSPIATLLVETDLTDQLREAKSVERAQTSLADCDSLSGDRSDRSTEKRNRWNERKRRSPIATLLVNTDLTD